MRIRMLTVAVLVAGTLVAPEAAVAAGRGPVLDPSFGDGGLAVTDHGGGDEVVDLALQPDGRIVAVGGGQGEGPGYGTFVVVRHLPDGGLDESFGRSGVVDVAVDPEAFTAYPAAVALRPDGRILVAGSVSRSGGSVPALVSYRPDGSVDTSFGADGRVFPDVGTSAAVSDMILRADGTVLLALGAATTDGTDPPVLLRLRADGTPDPAFGIDGLVRADLGPQPFDTVTAVAEAADGGILIAGSTGRWSTLPEPTSDVLLARFMPDGAPDRAFGAGGTVTEDLTGPEGIDVATGVAVAGDGRVVVTAGAALGHRSRALLLRYLPDGRRDPGFGRGGIAWAPLPRTSLTAPVIRPGGAVLVTGLTNDAGDQDLVLVQFRGDGRPDPRFGHRGVVRTDAGGAERGSVVRLRPDGRLVVGGTSGTQGGTSFTVFRYLP